MSSKDNINLSIEPALTYDDILLVPAYSDALPSDADISARLTRTIKLNVPLLSAAMDSVTEAPLAIAIAQEGGLGVIHRNMGVKEQVEHVRRVKKYESWVISDPVTVSPDATVEDVLTLTRKHRISGVPVVKGKNLEGIVTHRDLRFEPHSDVPVAKVMTPKNKLVTVREDADKEEVQSLLHKNRIEKVLVVNARYELKGLITTKDFQKSRDYPGACRDKYGRLLVGAAVGVGAKEQRRSEMLLDADVDVLVVDTAHGHTKAVLQMVRWLKKRYPDAQVVAGNIVTGEGARALMECGVDGVKVGVGPGSICTTRIVAGIGMPQVSAIMEVASALAGSDVVLVADGGIRFSGDVVKALAVGADVVMVGALFAGTLEAPGEVDTYQGRSYKSYRGMGSLAAMHAGSSDRYYQSRKTGKFVPEGVEGSVPYRGRLADVVQQLKGGLCAGMGYLGCRNLAEIRGRKIVRITQAGVLEGHVHDVTITKEAPNYRVN